MATIVAIPVAEYLHTTYHPDCDYIDGEVQERNLGEREHSSIPMMIGGIFLQNRRAWGLIPLPEQRVQVSASRFRIPDLCIVHASAPVTPIIEVPPLLCVEVLSPEDRFSRILERVEDYLAMGVPHVWIVDPHTREIWTVGATGRPILFNGTELTLPETPVRVEVSEIFALIDEAPRG